MDDKMRRINPDDLKLLKNTPIDRMATFDHDDRTSRLDSGASPTRSARACLCRDGIGWYTEAVPFGHPAFGVLQRCPCQAAGDAQKLTAALRKDRGRFARATFEAFDAERPVPDVAVWERSIFNPKMDGWDDQTYSPPEQRLMLRSTKAALVQYARLPAGWIWLQGSYGSGKTHLAASAANDLAARQYTTHYDSTPQLVKLLREGIADHSTDKRLEMLATVDLLVLDDFGMGHTSTWGNGQLEDLINERYNRERWTILTSNLPIEALSGRIGSRIAGDCQVITLVAYDIRLLPQRNDHDQL